MEKILLVDDEPDILEFLKYNLKKNGYDVATASDGAKAIKKAETFKPDLIILDIMMPLMDGIETCQALRQRTAFKYTPIAFLTAKDEDFTQIKALDIGGDDYITKPIKPRVLISRIQALLRRSNRPTESESTEIIEAASFLLDRSKYLVKKEGAVIEMPKKEFELLWLMASRPGRVFTREEIFDHIWDPDVIVGSRTIVVHIRKLREKIGDQNIKTIKGVGYKFDF